MLFAITNEQSQLIESLLVELLVRAEAQAVFFTDRGGNILAQNSTNIYQKEDNIAALASGSFFATQELASLVGEKEFHSMFHQGDTMSIYMQAATGDMLLMVIFGKESNPGLVRLYAKETAGALDKIVSDYTLGNDGMAQALVMKFEINDNSNPLFSPASGIGSS